MSQEVLCGELMGSDYVFKGLFCNCIENKSRGSRVEPSGSVGGSMAGHTGDEET